MQNHKRLAKFSTVLALTILMAACAPYDYNDPRHVSDSVITNKIRAEITADPALMYSTIHVDTTDQVVELTGMVDSVSDEAKVVEIANHVVGVMSVTDALAVRWAY